MIPPWKRKKPEQEPSPEFHGVVLHPFSQVNFWSRALRYGGTAPAFETPQDLMLAAEDYFNWCAANPLYEDKCNVYKGEVTRTPIAKLRAFTLKGLCLYLRITPQAFDNYRKPDHVLYDAAMIIDSIIRTQKFEAAAADLINPGLIARDLGLADKSELSGPAGGPIETKETSARELIAGQLARLSAAGSSEPDPSQSE